MTIINNDDILTINTNSPTKIVEEVIATLPILAEGHPKLSQVMPEFYITQIMQPEIQKFIRQMQKTQAAHNGLGLSANQVGISFRMFVIGDGIVCFNPRITATHGESVRKAEGCLSFPGLYLNVPRYECIDVRYIDENANLVTTRFEGLTAHVYQHELDHLNGVVYTQYVKPMAMQMARKRQAKVIKKHVRRNK
jgi:peptide deformylase